MSDSLPSMLAETHADIGILTVISEELDAAHKALPNLTRTKDPTTGTIYWSGPVRSELAKANYQVVLSCIGEPGNASSAAAATELLMKFRPRVLLLVGIAGGMRNKVKIGEVTFAERIVAYEPAAVVAGPDDSTRTEGRPDADRTPHRLWQDVIAYRPNAQRLHEKFACTQGTFPVPPLGKEEEYKQHVAASITITQSTVASGEKLFRDAVAISAMRRGIHGKIEVVEMEAAGVVNAARRADTPWLVVRGISDFGDALKDDQFHTFAANAASIVLVDFIEHGVDLGPGSLPPSWQTALRASEHWFEETRDVIGDNVRIAREKLVQRVLEATTSATVTVLLGDSGSGKSAIVKAIRSSSGLAAPMLCLHAQEAAGLVRTQGLDVALGAKCNDRFILVLDGLDRLASTEDFRAVARALRAVQVDSPISNVRLVLTCQTAEWDRVSNALADHNVSLGHYERVGVTHLDDNELSVVAGQVGVIAPLLLRNELRPMIGRPKVLDVVVRAATRVGLPDVAQWVGESDLIEWVWEKYIRADDRGDPHVRLLQHLAVCQADDRAFAIPLVDLSSYDVTLLDALVRLGILVRRHDTVKFAHELYADYARQRYLLSLISAERQQELKPRLTNPLWHRSIRLLGLHLLERKDVNDPSNTEGWRRLVRSFDERHDADELEQPAESEGRRPGTGVDLLLEAVAFSVQPHILLDRIFVDLMANDGAMLRSLLFRLNHVARQSLRLRELFDTTNLDAAALAHADLDQEIALPEYRIWAPLVEWISEHSHSVFEHAASEFLDAAEFWLLGTRAVFDEQTFRNRTGQLLSTMVVALAERYAASDRRGSSLTFSGDRQDKLFLLLLVCARQEPERGRSLVRCFAGMESPKEPRPKVIRSIVPPDYIPLEDIPEFWPLGPKSEPSEAFRRVAFSRFGAEQLVALDSKFACEAFLALLIEIPSEERYDGLDRDSYKFEAGRLASPPFWDFPPAQVLLSSEPDVGIDFVVKATDFGVDRWMVHWPNVPREGTIFDALPPAPPSITLQVGDERRVYTGDSRVLDWHRGGSKGPDVAAALLMSLEHWLYEQSDRDALTDDMILGILCKTHSVAVLGVLFDLALRDPSKLLGPLEALVQCPELYIWSRHRLPNIDTALIAWSGSSSERISLARDWHNLTHRRHDLLLIVSHAYAMSDFRWPALVGARDSWAQVAADTSNPRLAAWIRDMMLPYTDRGNWRPSQTADGRRALEYVHPVAIDSRQQAERREIEDGAMRRHLPIRCRRIIDGEERIEESDLVGLLELSAMPIDTQSEEETWLLGGKWTPRCGVAAVALLRCRDWLHSNAAWEGRCVGWLIDACKETPLEFRPYMDVSDISWDAFCADVMPQLWAATPEDTKLRWCVARLAAAPHDVARKRLYVNLAKAREAHPEDFSRLLHLAAWFARLSALDPAPMPEVDEPEYLSNSIKEAFLALVDEFVRKKMSLLPRDWADIATARPSGLKRNPHGELSGFRETVLVSAFLWLGAESLRYSEAHDRDQLLAHVEQLAAVVSDRLSDSYDEEAEWTQRLKRFRPRAGSEYIEASVAATPMTTPFATRSRTKRVLSELARKATKRIEHFRARTPDTHVARAAPRRGPIGTPNLADYTIAELIAAYLVREPDTEARRVIWTRWLSLSDPCHHWTSLLLDQIYVVAGQIPRKESHVAALMKDLFEYASRERGWLDGKDRQLHGVSDVARAFLGVGGLAGGGFWTAENEHVALELGDHLKRWAQKAIGWYGCAEALARFLRKPAASSLRPSCLHWVSSAYVAGWDADAQEGFAALLRLIWEERAVPGHGIAGSTRDRFESFLNALNGQHIASAVQLLVDVRREGAA